MGSVQGYVEGLGASFREEHLTLAEREEINVLKINDDDDDRTPNQESNLFPGTKIG